MNVKAELHHLVDQLSDEQTSGALMYLRQLLYAEETAGEKAATALALRMQPPAVTGRAFFELPSRDLAALATEQGVRPVADFNDLLGDFWPQEETADEFIAAVRQWRQEGGYA